MNVYLNKVSGIDDAIVTLFISRRKWTRELEEDIRATCQRVISYDGLKINEDASEEDLKKFKGWMDTLVKWGWQHITMLRYIDFSITVEGLHRAGQDDWDAHARRYDNRIIRMSTRDKEISNEFSSYYQGNIISTDEALEKLGIDIPMTITDDNGREYVRVTNGYVAKDMNTQDMRRGLYFLAMASNFTFKVNLTEFAHVYKERNIKGGAHPEVKELAETIVDKISEIYPWFDRELLLKIKN